MNTKETIDRRNSERFQTLNLLSYIERDENGCTVSQGIAKTIDISETGALIEIQNQLININKVSFELALEEQIVPLDAEIVEQHQITNSCWRVRVKFKNMRPSIWHRLASFLRELQ